MDDVLTAFFKGEVYALGEPAGDTSVPGKGTESDLLVFTVDGFHGEEVVLPVWCDPQTLRIAARRRKGWRSHQILSIAGRNLLDNLGDDVMVVINLGTPLEYRITSQEMQSFVRRQKNLIPQPEEESSSAVGLAIAVAAQRPYRSPHHQVLSSLYDSEIYAFYEPAGDMTTLRQDAPGDVLYFSPPATPGIDDVVVPVWPDLVAARLTANRDPFRQSRKIRRIPGRTVIEDTDNDVTIVIAPWTPVEFRIEPNHRAKFLRGQPLALRKLEDVGAARTPPEAIEEGEVQITDVEPPSEVAPTGAVGVRSVRARANAIGPPDESRSEIAEDAEVPVTAVQPSGNAVATAAVGLQSLRARLDAAGMPAEIRHELEPDLVVVEAAEVAEAADLTVERYRRRLGFISRLPWNVRVSRPVELQTLRTLLDKNHYGMIVAKQTILEYVAVLARSERFGRSFRDVPKLCLVGPPGVGKSTLARSIATGLGRPMQSLSLGGFADAQALRGFHRTYVGAQAGEIMNAVMRLGALDGVLRLDELDKAGSYSAGGANPTDVLLELLDPDQSPHFRDLYLDVPFNLSEIMFIGAANDLDTIHPALRDRFEVIELPPYTQDEKLAIVSRYVLPRMRETHFLSDEQVHVSEDALAALAKRSASAPGVRPLESDLRRLLRRAVLLLQEGEAHVSIDAETVADWLGPATGRRSVGFAPPPR